MKWNEKNSDYMKEYREEVREIERRDQIKGMSKWEWACIGAGSEDKLLEEIRLSKVKELEIEIKRLRLKISYIVKDPTNLYIIKKKRDKISDELIAKHRVFEDGEQIYFHNNRYLSDMHEMEDKLGWDNASRQLEEFEKKEEYLERLREMYDLKKLLNNRLSKEEIIEVFNDFKTKR